LSKYGRIIAITEETLINDDLKAFNKLSQFGSSAARLESKLVYDILLNNAAMSDTFALFHANHGNLGTAGAVNETTLTELKKKMREQKGLDAQDYLNLYPAFLIVGPAKEVEAQKMLSAIVSTKASDTNVFSNSMKLIVESRITGNKFFAAADPSMIDTILLAYMDGMRGPVVETKQGFEIDGMMIKCKHVVGAKAIEYRGLFYNAGN
jgi:hypothetical protein